MVTWPYEYTEVPIHSCAGTHAMVPHGSEPSCACVPTHTRTRPFSACSGKRRCWVSGYVCPQPCDTAQSFTTWLHQHASSIFHQPGLYFCALMPELVPVGLDALFLWHGALTRCCDYSNSPTCGTEKLKSVISLSRNKENNRKNDNSADSNGSTTP